MVGPKLNLPLEYKIMPEFFDVHNICDDTKHKNAVLEKLLKQEKVHSVLDMTCGTGSQVFYLAERGYGVTGSDFSPGLIEIARQKSAEAQENIRFVIGDMRTLKVGKFDAVITMFNAIGHLTRAGFEKALGNIRKNLAPGGIYIFDIFNLESMDEEEVAKLAMDYEREEKGTRIHHVQRSELDKARGLLTSFDTYRFSLPNGSIKKVSHKFTLQIYGVETLANMLQGQGFEIVGQYETDGSDFVRGTSPTILVVAKKTS